MLLTADIAAPPGLTDSNTLNVVGDDLLENLRWQIQQIHHDFAGR